MIRGLITLAFGALSFGIVEFVVMGLLPYIAADFNVTTAQAGHTISAYALGVVAGAFFMIFMHKLPLKHILFLVIFIHFTAVICTYFAPSFELLLACRVLAGMPHGCFFGVGAIVAQRLATKGKGSSAMAIMIAGQTLSNVFGVPLGTLLANYFSWRAIFFLMMVWSAFVLICVIFMLPSVGKLEDHGFKSQFHFLAHKAPWLVLGMVFFGSAGMFCVQTYISPILTDLGGVELIHVSSVLVASGICMMAANIISGHVADKLSPGTSCAGFFALGATAMVGISLFGSITVLCIICVCAVASVLFGVGTPEQVLLVRTSKGGELLGVAMGQVGFNSGNALGAYAGGFPFMLGLPINTVPLIGLVFLALACICVFIFQKKCDAQYRS